MSSDPGFELSLSVRQLVEFLLRAGDIDESRGGPNPVRAMRLGTRLHKKIQDAAGLSYHAEVPLLRTFDMDGYTLTITGRADGILYDDGENPLTDVTVDEIKGIFADVSKLEEPQPLHLAQAKCYAAIFAGDHDLSRIGVTVTYGNLEHISLKDLNRFSYTFSRNELEKWFYALIEEYRRWSDLQYRWQRIRRESYRSLSFPFPKREGQHKLMKDVYRSILREKLLFVQAPTGTGKTIAAIFPALKAVGEGLAERIFYLTAKTVTRTVAKNTFALLRENGMRAKTIELTAKDRICPLEKRSCRPADCPRAKGHFDRINDAIYDLLTKEDLFDRETIETFAEERCVCPFELSLDLALFCDNIIGDYNYAFDPNASLKRFFSEGERGRYLFLIDEAHNLIDRARDMYSESLFKEDFLAVRRELPDKKTNLAKALNKCNTRMLPWKKECEKYTILSDIDEFVMSLMQLSAAFEDFFEKAKEPEITDEMRELYFNVKNFLALYELLDDTFKIYCSFTGDGRFFVRLLNIDPSAILQDRYQAARSVVFFSATLLPVDYYKKLLCREKEPYAICAESTFDRDHLLLLGAHDVTSRYKNRNEETYRRFALYTQQIIAQKKGNYMIFAPSYSFMSKVLDHFTAPDDTEILVQTPAMDEEERDTFLKEFEAGREGSLAAFCVMGGIFAEGIDLVGEALIGAVILGLPLPMVTNERTIIADHFRSSGRDGFLYAYLYPGMNKVLQAAGRVIRTADDVGVVALLDERFFGPSCRSSYPAHWPAVTHINTKTAAETAAEFWNR